jgi:hypothetical protein
MEKIVRYGLYVGVTLLLFIVFQQQCAYDFFYAEQLRSFLFSEAYAQQVLAQLPLTDERKKPLWDLAEYLLGRKS